MTPTYKIRVMFYKMEGEETKQMYTNEMSGQEIQSLEDLIRGFTPNGAHMNIDLYDEVKVTCENDEGLQVSFPEDWCAAYLYKLIPIRPGRYGLNSWPTLMYVKFEAVHYRDEDCEYDYER